MHFTTQPMSFIICKMYACMHYIDADTSRSHDSIARGIYLHTQLQCFGMLYKFLTMHTYMLYCLFNITSPKKDMCLCAANAAPCDGQFYTKAHTSLVQFIEKQKNDNQTTHKFQKLTVISLFGN